jgi:hypothetical protein
MHICTAFFEKPTAFAHISCFHCVFITACQKSAREFSSVEYFLARSQNFVKQLLASSCLSVCQSVRVEQLDFHWTGFDEI